jgi:hypothetical protein
MPRVLLIYRSELRRRKSIDEQTPIAYGLDFDDISQFLNSRTVGPFGHMPIEALKHRPSVDTTLLAPFRCHKIVPKPEGLRPPLLPP